MGENYGSLLPQRGNDIRILEAKILLALGGGASGVGGVQAGNYAGGQPNFTPASGAGAAIDTSNGHIWWYYNGQWN